MQCLPLPLPKDQLITQHTKNQYQKPTSAAKCFIEICVFTHLLHKYDQLSQLSNITQNIQNEGEKENENCEKKDLIISDPITVMFGSSSYLK